MRFIVLAGLCLGTFLATGLARAEQRFQSGPAKVPLIELYTSEGCSSCPPAERWLSTLRSNPDLWKAFVPVAFHVTYWDKLGWTDQFAQRMFTERQYAYAALWQSESVYTPCFIRDGSEWKSRDLTRDPSAPPAGQLTLVVDATGQAAVHFSPANSATEPLFGWLALLSSNVDSNVERGENAGRKLRHDFTVVELTKARLTADGDKNNLVATLAFNRTALTKAPESAIAAWITVGEQPGIVIQATGGWLGTSTP